MANTTALAGGVTVQDRSGAIWHFPETNKAMRLRVAQLHPGALADCQTCGWLYR